jgi:hypothetical protein
MAIAYKPAQVQGTASTGTYATLYETPSATEAVISTIVICNTAAATATYRIGLDTTAGTPGASEWLVYDATVPANDTTALTLGVSLDAGRFIRVSSSADTVTFSAFVSEIS